MAASKDKKNKALELAISQVDRQFGKGSIMKQIIVFLQDVYH